MGKTCKWAFGMLIFAIVALAATWSFSAQHCINIDVNGKVAAVSYSSPDSLGAIVVMLDFGDCVVKEVKWGEVVPSSGFNFIYLDGNRLTAACFGVSSALPSGQNVKLLKIHLYENNCTPDTFTNAVGSRTAMVKTDAHGVVFDVNFDYTDVSDDEDEASTLPDKFSIGAPYPNPFNPSTTVKYIVPEKGLVKIVVYNIRGQEVACLVDSEHTPGVYFIKWDAQQASGVYFIRMSSSTFSDKKKVVLLK